MNLRSFAIGMRIDQRLVDDRRELRALQAQDIEALQQENLPRLSKRAGRLAIPVPPASCPADHSAFSRRVRASEVAGESNAIALLAAATSPASVFRLTLPIKGGWLQTDAHATSAHTGALRGRSRATTFSRIREPFVGQAHSLSHPPPTLSPRPGMPPAGTDRRHALDDAPARHPCRRPKPTPFGLLLPAAQPRSLPAITACACLS